MAWIYDAKGKIETKKIESGSRYTPELSQFPEVFESKFVGVAGLTQFAAFVSSK